jgi:ABC-type branched-subunit amino acid transport system ATPase component
MNTIPDGAVAAGKPRLAATLRVEHLCKRFGGLEVFRDISFELPAGSVLGVIGPNGAGKTTLINVICGMLAPSSGRIMLGDQDISGLPFHTLSRQGVVRSFQQTNTFRSETVRENLLRSIQFSRGDTVGWEEIQDLLVEFELDGIIDERSDNLPYGSQKMLGLLMAYLTRPAVLLLDEPAAGLERSERPRIDRLVQAAQSRVGCSVLIVEHDMELIKRLCPSGIVLDAGRVLASGPPSEVLARPDVIDAYMGASEEG